MSTDDSSGMTVAQLQEQLDDYPEDHTVTEVDTETGEVETAVTSTVQDYDVERVYCDMYITVWEDDDGDYWLQHAEHATTARDSNTMLVTDGNDLHGAIAEAVTDD